MKSLLRIGSENKGSVAILALIGMMVLGVIGAGFVMITSTEVDTGAQYRDGVTAQYLAEAGARWAAIQLKNNVSTVVAQTDSANGQSYSAGPFGTLPNAGGYSVTVRRNPAAATDSKQRQVVSTGTVNKAKRQVVFVVSLGGGGVPADYAAYGQKTILLAGSVYGDIGAANSVTLKWGYAVGNIAAETIYQPNGEIKYGTAPTGTLQIVFPVSFDINNAAYQQYRNGAITRPTNTVDAKTGRATLDLHNYSAPAWAGNNYVNGNLELTGSTVLPMTGTTSAIYVNGDFSIHNNCTINANGNLAIVANGAINLDPGKIRVPAGSKITLFARDGVTIESGAATTGDLEIISPQKVTVRGGSSSLTSGSSGTVKIYTQDRFELSGGATIAGYGLVMTGYTGADSIRVTGGSNAGNTIMMASGDAYISAITGPVLAKGVITLDYGAEVHYNQEMFEQVGVTIGSYSMLDWTNRP